MSLARRIAWCCVISVALSGCASMLTKWECKAAACLPREQAINKCLAQANAAFASSSEKAAIWEQCMRNEGFQEVQCAEAERWTNPDCHFLFVH